MSEALADAEASAAMLAADAGLRGVVLRSDGGPVLEGWLAALRGRLPEGAPWVRVPGSVEPERLTGGVDLAATLAARRPVMAAGLLAGADGGVLLVPGAERLEPGVAATIAAAMDAGAGFRLVLIDEGVEEDAGVAPVLVERVGLMLDLRGLRVAPSGWPVAGRADAALPAGAVEGLSAAAAALAIPSLRPLLFACRAARAAAGLFGRAEAGEQDLARAVRLVLMPRARALPGAAAADAPPSPPDPGDAPEDSGEAALAEMLVEAVRAALPAGLLAALAAGQAPRGSSGGRGKGRERAAPANGRRGRVRMGAPRGSWRLDLVETLKAAAPWQGLRGGRGGVMRVSKSDFRVRRRLRRAGATTLFVVDASGSSALARLNEAKGAVELLLADAYVRRDEVALIAFRGEGAELLLPPTRSLARAKRALGDMVGGGGTPLGAAIEAAAAVARAIVARGRQAQVVFLTDARANVSRGELPAVEDALAAARGLQGFSVVLIDSSTRVRAEGVALAAAMGARHVALPRADAAAIRGVLAR
ncbi:VWA domain-containing protein [Sandaracinobacteroides saxicola]|uniref:VWA domain-containing protein n=1 Tax=Sandaracinobacteroides saxicola TaxID=2759707 RepID=UPI002112884D|nr:VWA domain-containing protein [Sandaracinobacteroides saxicola]